MSQELIVVKQLPIIEERLRTISETIKDRTQAALSLVCTEDTVKEIKRVRAELSKHFNELETQRKAVKNKVLSPYEQFEAVYKACVTEVYAPADAKLKLRISEVENAVKEEKRTEIVAFLSEYAKSKGIEFITFAHTGIQVTLAASIKSMRTAAAAFVDRVVEELALIDTQEFKEEVLVEYKISLNVANAITSVVNRHAAIEAERRNKEAAQAEFERREAAARITEAVAAEALAGGNDRFLLPPRSAPIAPEEGSAVEPVKTCTTYTTFTVYGTLEELKALKRFLTDGGYRYDAQ